MKDLTKTLATIFAVALIIWAIGFTAPKLIDIYKNKPVEKADTVVKQKVDTIWVREPHAVGTIKWRKIVDTLVTTKHDTVEVLMPLATKGYEGSEVTPDGSVEIAYRAYVSGYRANLDSIFFKIEHNDSIITKEVTKIVEKKKKGFKIAPAIGVGYGVVNRKPDIWVGVSISYNF